MGSRRSWFIRGILLAAVVACLTWQASRLDLVAVQRALRGDVHWPSLVIGLGVSISAVLFTFLRWWLLVHALRIPLTLGQAIQLGFVGYFMQFFSLGTIGGDVFKAILIARNSADRRLEAISTILVDRLLGMLSLLLFASLILTRSRDRGLLPPEFYPLRWVYLVAAGIGVLCVILILYTRINLRDLVWWSGPLRRLLPLASRVDAALGHYRHHRAVVLLAIGIGMVSHAMHAIALYIATRGITDQAPNLVQQMSIWPIAAVAGALPLTPAGLGTFDAAYTYLFNWFVNPDLHARVGLLVTIVFRIYCLITAGLGVLLYVLKPSQFQGRDGEKVPSY